AGGDRMTITTSPVRPDRAAILDALDMLVEPGALVELCILEAPRAGTISGYFDDRAKLAETAVKYDGKGEGIYITFNQLGRRLLGRADNRVIERAKHRTADKDVERRRWFAVECDPDRPAGVCATDEEHRLALARVKE